MTKSIDIELKNVDSGDISDVLTKVEKSFGFKFGKTELKDVRTFCELCDIIESKVSGENDNHCTTQQCFYKVRDILAMISSTNKDLINPDTHLETLFPRDGRRRRIKKLQYELGTTVDILEMKDWIGTTIFLGIVASVIVLFFEWQFALLGLGFFTTLGIIVSSFFSKELSLETVGQLTKKIVRENYRNSRRNDTINRKEVEEIVKDLFKCHLDLEDAALTRQAVF
jgi:hypothetical protein